MIYYEKEKYKFLKEIKHTSSKKQRQKKTTKQAVLIRNKIETSVAINKTD